MHVDRLHVPRVIRLVRFNSVALGGTVALSGWLGLPLLAANLLAIACASTWNYLVSLRID